MSIIDKPDPGTSAIKIADALRDVADMVEALGLDVRLTVSVSAPTRSGQPHVHIEPGRDCNDAAQVRPTLDAIASYIGVSLRASFSRGEFWNFLSTPWQGGRLPRGATAGVGQRLRGRPLDLAPMPKRRRNTVERGA